MEANAILRLLPAVYADTRDQSEVLQALLGIMQGSHEEPERIVADIDLFFRPTATADRYLPALASWMDLGWLFTGEQRAGREPYGPGSPALRQLIARARVLSDHRGTAQGLTSFLETAIGVSGFSVRTSANQPFHIEVTVPAAVDQHRDLIERIVRHQKPVCSTHHLTWPDATPAMTPVAEAPAHQALQSDPTKESEPTDD